MGHDCNLASHPTLPSTSPVQMIGVSRQAARSVRRQTLVGFQSCASDTSANSMCMVKAMAETGTCPTLSRVDGTEGGSRRRPAVGVCHQSACPMVEGLPYVHNTFARCPGIRDQVKLGAAGKVVFRPLIFRGRWPWARIGLQFGPWGFMFAVGCIQAQACRTTNQCPRWRVANPRCPRGKRAPWM